MNSKSLELVEWLKGRGFESHETHTTKIYEMRNGNVFVIFFTTLGQIEVSKIRENAGGLVWGVEFTPNSPIECIKSIIEQI